MTGQTGLVGFYDIRAGNGAGLFFQPWSPNGVVKVTNCHVEDPGLIYNRLGSALLLNTSTRLWVFSSAKLSHLWIKVDNI